MNHGTLIKMAKEETKEQMKNAIAVEVKTAKKTGETEIKTIKKLDEIDVKTIQKDEESHLIKPIEEEAPPARENEFDADSWKPKTLLGKKVKSSEITDVDQILNSNAKLLESEIIDMLMPALQSDLLMIGQSKGKFGGGQRRVFKQTQKKTKEGNKPSFATCAVVGDANGHVGIGYGKARETVPAREKAVRNAKLNMIKIRRGCGSWQCNCKEAHSIPFAVEGRSGSVRIKLIPAPKGTGLCAGGETGKILKMAGVSDIWVRTAGITTSRINAIMAAYAALKKLMEMKVQQKYKERLNLAE
jgi:small subunit ribosomal protein S5